MSQLAAVQQESLQYHQQYAVVPMMAAPLPAPSPLMEPMSITAACPHVGPPSPLQVDTATPQAVVSKLHDR